MLPVRRPLKGNDQGVILWAVRGSGQRADGLRGRVWLVAQVGVKVAVDHQEKRRGRG